MIFYYAKSTGYDCLEKRYYFYLDDLIKIILKNPADDCNGQEYQKLDYSAIDNFKKRDLENANTVISKAKKYKSMFSFLNNIE